MAFPGLPVYLMPLGEDVLVATIVALCRRANVAGSAVPVLTVVPPHELSNERMTATTELAAEIEGQNERCAIIS